MKKLYVDFTPPNSLIKFIGKFYDYNPSDRCYRYSTITTYKDKDCTEVDFKAKSRYGHSRSFDVLYRLANTYYGKVSPKKLLRAIRANRLQVRACGDINTLTIYGDKQDVKNPLIWNELIDFQSPCYWASLANINLETARALCPRMFEY